MKRLVTAPETEPVTLVEAKAHLRQDLSDDDGLITALIVAAREQAESFTGRALMLQTWELYLDAFPCRIDLSLPPLKSVDLITYVDEDGQTQTLAADQYTVVSDHNSAYIVPAYDVSWPSTRSVPNAVTVKFTAGYDSADDVPKTIKQAMLLLVGEMYENTEETGPSSLARLPLTAERLLWAYKDMRG